VVHFAAGHRVLVLNDSFDRSWRLENVHGVHIASALGTNVWLLPASPPTAPIAHYALTPFFHWAFIAGIAVIVLGLLRALTSNAWRPLRHEAPSMSADPSAL
jgi:hypothetical protein